MNNNNFGIIVTCCDRDFWMAKACCASIRYFMGDFPICLLIDGDIHPSKLIDKYGVEILNKRNVNDNFLRENSFGYGITKMVAFWESPFDKFLLIDADTIIWGNLEKLFIKNEFDLITERTNKNYSFDDISKWFFNPDKIKNIDPKFSYNSNDFFSTGVLLAKKNIIKVEYYKEILDMSNNMPDLFKFGEMGFFNYMIIKQKNLGNISVGHLINHTNVCYYSINTLKEKYNIELINNSTSNYEPSIIHYVGNYRPYINSKVTYSNPFTFFRKKYIKDCYHTKLLANDYFLKLEEQTYFRPRVRKILDKFI